MRIFNKIFASFLVLMTFSFGQTQEILSVEEIIETYYKEALFTLRAYYGLDSYDSLKIHKSTLIFEQEKVKLEQLKKDLQGSGNRDSRVIVKILKARLHKEFPMLNSENYYSRVNSSLNALYARKRNDG